MAFGLSPLESRNITVKQNLAVVGTLTVTGAQTSTGVLDASAAGVKTLQSVANVHDSAPTQAEMVSALGAASRGKLATIDDADADARLYVCAGSDASWYYVLLAKGA